MAGLGNRDGMALGSALNARGALEIVIATVGLSLGVLNDASYTIVVIMAIATSIMAAPLLRAITRNWEGSPDEVIRLKREKRMATNVLIRPTRALVVADEHAEGTFAAELVNAALPDESPMTILRTSDDQDAVLDIMRVLQHRDLELRAMNGSAVEELLRQAAMGYGLIVAGTTATKPEDLSAEDTELLRIPDLPVLLARPARGQSGTPSRILLPLSTTVPARAATEVAVALASKLGAELDLLYVRSDANGDDEASHTRRISYRGASDPVAQRMFSSVSDAAREAGIWPRRITTDNASRAAGIIEVAQDRGSDLIVVGVEVQDVSGAVHLGQTATLLLADPSIGLLIVALGPR
jgi:nucleotide-binding universal stress UspA family protein